MIWLVVVLVFGVLILVHELGHLFAAKRAGIGVEAFSLGMGKRLFGVKIGETDYRISMIPFGGFCQMAGEDPTKAEGKDNEFGSKPVGKRFWVIAAGSVANYIFAFILFSVIYMIGAPVLSNQVGQLLKGYPAEKAGMAIGDRIVSVNGEKVTYWDDVVETIKDYKENDAPLSVGITRGEKDMMIAVRPDVATVKNVFGQVITRPMIGVAPKEELLSVSYGPIPAFYQGGKRLLELTGMTYKGIWLLMTGGMPLKTSVSGPIGIAHLIGQAANMGIVPVMIIMAHVSMALAIFNLLPFPVLDGGHIIFLAIEKIKKRPVSVKVQEVVTQAALFLLIAFALFVSWQDILKFTPIGK